MLKDKSLGVCIPHSYRNHGIILVPFHVCTVFIYVCVGGIMCAHVCGGSRLTSGAFLSHFLPYALRQILLNPGITLMTSLASQPALCLPLSLCTGIKGEQIMSPGALSPNVLMFVPFPLSGLTLILVDCFL